MALDRFLHLPEERRRALLEVAARMFAEHGYDGTSYNELLREVGLGKSQAYYYFEDKADFFVTAVAAVYESYYELVAKLPRPKSVKEFWAHIEALHLAGFHYQAENKVAGQLSLALLRSPVRFQLGEALLGGVGSTRKQHRSWVLEGQRLGAVRTDLPRDLLVEMSINQSLFVDEWFAEHHLRSSRAKRKKLAAQFTDVARRLFQP
jgi:AcrR family transcriptional regulator